MLAAGQHTIGRFRIRLVEPEEVEPTVFQLTVTTRSMRAALATQFTLPATGQYTIGVFRISLG